MADYIVHNFVARMLSINVNNNNNRAIQFYSKLTTFNRTENSLARSLFIKIMLLFIMCYILSINNIILVKMHMFAKTSIVFHMIFSFRGYVIKKKKRDIIWMIIIVYSTWSKLIQNSLEHIARESGNIYNLFQYNNIIIYIK